MGQPQKRLWRRHSARMKYDTTQGWRHSARVVGRPTSRGSFGLIILLDTRSPPDAVRITVSVNPRSSRDGGFDTVPPINAAPAWITAHALFDVSPERERRCQTSGGRFNAVSTARKTFKPALIYERPPADPLGSTQCPESLSRFECRSISCYALGGSGAKLG